MPSHSPFGNHFSHFCVIRDVVDAGCRLELPMPRQGWDAGFRRTLRDYVWVPFVLQLERRQHQLAIVQRDQVFLLHAWTSVEGSRRPRKSLRFSLSLIVIVRDDRVAGQYAKPPDRGASTWASALTAAVPTRNQRGPRTDIHQPSNVYYGSQLDPERVLSAGFRSTTEHHQSHSSHSPESPSADAWLRWAASGLEEVERIRRGDVLLYHRAAFSTGEWCWSLRWPSSGRSGGRFSDDRFAVRLESRDYQVRCYARLLSAVWTTVIRHLKQPASNSSSQMRLATTSATKLSSRYPRRESVMVTPLPFLVIEWPVPRRALPGLVNVRSRLDWTVHDTDKSKTGVRLDGDVWLSPRIRSDDSIRGLLPRLGGPSKSNVAFRRERSRCCVGGPDVGCPARWSVDFAVAGNPPTLTRGMHVTTGTLGDRFWMSSSYVLCVQLELVLLVAQLVL
ncbi:Phospho-2-dehydro-3-deoxyheptonate aldolase [Mycena chlorophos]|uniref:Phospho-2-dehydro-3-deoxyheptonate aldolase n=1 Tax=Mycena chlorophos TaxID=658473 RepID=A0A8H6SCA3_MYCCL|nr:Phospho-2-dehydro-3-deoxyheptonate aldolase [Mycena chlorophos]